MMLIILTLVFGTVGVLCAAMGIVTAADVDTKLSAEFTPMVWLTLGVISLLVCIAAILFRDSSYD